MKPSTAIVLRMLRSAGPRGVTTHELLQGGAGSRYGGRIHELRAAGYEIEATRIRQGSYRYVLTHEPSEIGAGQALASADLGGRLFAPPPQRAFSDAEAL